MALKILKNDTVVILTGRDRGKTGKVVNVDRKSASVTVEGLNMLTRYRRPRKAGQKGEKVSLPAPLPQGKVMLMCPHTGKPTRVSFGKDKDGKRIRISKRSGKPIG